jgi:hypothetical protein
MDQSPDFAVLLRQSRFLADRLGSMEQRVRRAGALFCARLGQDGNGMTRHGIGGWGSEIRKGLGGFRIY